MAGKMFMLREGKRKATFHSARIGGIGYTQRIMLGNSYGGENLIRIENRQAADELLEISDYMLREK